MSLSLDQPKREFLFLGTGTSVGVPMLGCGCKVCLSPNPKHRRTRTSVLISTSAGRILIDTPPELRVQLLREGVSHAHAVLFTHSHADHVFGFDDVRTFQYRLGGPLPVYCVPEVGQFLQTAFAYAFGSNHVHHLEMRLIDTAPFRVLDQEVVPIPLLHGPFHTLGFRFGNLAFCTDVNCIPDASWPLLQGLDILILDALRFDPHPTHFTFDEALAVIEKLQPRQAYLTHISCKLDPEEAERRLPSNVALAYDGLRFAF